MAEEQPAWVLKILEENPDCEEENCIGYKFTVYSGICRQDVSYLSNKCREHTLMGRKTGQRIYTRYPVRNAAKKGGNNIDDKSSIF